MIVKKRLVDWIKKEWSKVEGWMRNRSFHVKSIIVIFGAILITSGSWLRPEYLLIGYSVSFSGMVVEIGVIYIVYTEIEIIRDDIEDTQEEIGTTQEEVETTQNEIEEVQEEVEEMRDSIFEVISTAEGAGPNSIEGMIEDLDDEIQSLKQNRGIPQNQLQKDIEQLERHIDDIEDDLDSIQENMNSGRGRGGIK